MFFKIVKPILVSVLALTLTACGTMDIIATSARLECSDNWGRTIPLEKRTADNCWDMSHRVLAEQGYDMSRTTSSSSAGNMSGTHTYITPAGTYQVSRVGSSTTIVTQTARGRR